MSALEFRDPRIRDDLSTYLGRAARIEDGAVIRSVSQVAVGDLGGGAGATYRVLCRRHWREGEPGPGVL